VAGDAKARRGMVNVVWNLLYDNVNQKNWSDVFGPVILNGAILPGAIATQFHLQDGDYKATFQGNFVVNSGVIQSGTITGFDLFFKNPAGHVLDATGYQIDFVAFKQALAALQATSSTALLDLLFGAPMTVHGTAQVDGFGQGNSDDTLFGNSGPDKLGGDDGDDRIFGGDGDDLLTGGNGDDAFVGGEGMDNLHGGPGSDTADYSSEANFVRASLDGPNTTELLVGGTVEDLLAFIENVTSGSGNDELVGDGFNNTFAGNAGDDKLTGNDGNDHLLGGDGKDKLNGGKGNDEIAGGLGNDVVIGGKDSDTLVFDAPLNAKKNVDKVKKFSPGKDMIELDQAVFASLDPGALKGKHFRLGEKAKDGNDHILYDEGLVRYDPDGKGGAKAVLFAKLKSAPDIDADNFLVA
jgi:Ca2+-binding RTX toxin-like protein